MLLKVLIIVVVSIIILPTVALGSSFVSSLIAGKTPAEAAAILGEQLDHLLGRVEAVETAQEVITEQVEAAT